VPSLFPFHFPGFQLPILQKKSIINVKQATEYVGH
jgi:hypothetical protein